MDSYPLMTLRRFIYWITVARIQKIRPLWYLDYSKENAKRILIETYDWQDYGGHHLENKLTAFYHEVYAPRKFGTDFRQNVLAARVRNGEIDRTLAITEFTEKDVSTKYLEKYFRDRLSLSEADYEIIMRDKPRIWSEFPTYKRFFEFFSPFFFVASKLNLVPFSFYLKYCKKVSHDNNH